MGMQPGTALQVQSPEGILVRVGQVEGVEVMWYGVV